MLAQQYLEAELQSLLYESLLAEHAARFISMDNATRNAEKLLEETKSDYNKLRQAKITKELTELTSSFSLHS
jgi:F-type H+-transporting ATPase subunit gamma